MRSFQLPVISIFSGVRGVLNPARRINLVSLLLSVLLLGGATSIAFAQSVNSRISGTVKDTAGAVVPGAKVTLTDKATKDQKEVTTSEEGTFTLNEVRPGTYNLAVEGTGFKKLNVTELVVNVDTPVVLNSLTLEAGGVTETVSVTASDAQSLIRSEDAKLTSTIDVKQVQDLPLNGRYFLDLGLLVPGSVTPPQGAFSASPMRGLGSLAVNTTGNREETVNYTINGVTLNNLTFASISFQPSINTIQEFKADNSTFNAEFGGSSGAIVNIATRSGANQFHGELFEFFRNDALDARNFFELTSHNPAPFKRNQ
ncbi:MAG TPA: carboxypeptidase-like regulatory domain-containing protein, partial [Pyrinomonadaceae bacterium]